MDTNNPIRVSFQDFWPGFTPHSFFVPLVAEATKREVLVTTSLNSDLAFFSVFRKRNYLRTVASKLGLPEDLDLSSMQHTKNPRQKRIWFTGENRRPPLDPYDLTLSFDLDPLGGTNVYLPLILTQIGWFKRGQSLSLECRRSGITCTPNMVKTGRQTNVAERKRFLCAFIGNSEPTRMRALQVLSSYGEVDIFGSAVGRPVPSKSPIAKDYRFMLCFENDLYPGYVTEKPLDAWLSGCIPLWRGLDQYGVLNPSSVMNAASYDTLDSFVDMVAQVDRNVEDMSAIGSQPLISEHASLSEVLIAIRKVSIS